MDNVNSRKCNVLLGCTGSVASIKVPQIVQELSAFEHRVNIKVIATKNALHFFDKSALCVPVLGEQDETQITFGELHVELSQWADVLVIAPLSANTLAKLATGIADNLLTRIVKSWDLSRRLLFAPAMNTLMWQHPITSQQIDKLLGFHFQQIECIEKTLACGDTGKGAMAEVSTIIDSIISNCTVCRR